MESDLTPQQALATAERASAAPFLDYPPTPWWYFPAVGAWAAALVLALGELGGEALFVPVIVALLGAEGAFFAWYRSYRGTWPSLRGAPREFRGVMRAYAAGCVLVLAVVVAVALAIGPRVAAAVAFLAVTSGLLVYERRYEAAARAARERLG